MPDDVSGNRQGFDPAPYVLTDSGRSVVLGRYSTSSADPPSDLIEPVNAVASLTFPRQTVRSIREAIDYALLRSGYRFDDGAVDDAGRRFLELPLPESQRQIGPYPLSTILSVLMGSAWQPAVDLAGRVVSIRATAQTSTPCAVTGRCLVRVTWMAQGAASIAGAAPVKPVSSGLQTNPAPVNRIYPNPKAGETP
jgi:type IV pili sensor histidine kinase/response regulator